LAQNYTLFSYLPNIFLVFSKPNSKKNIKGREYQNNFVTLHGKTDRKRRNERFRTQ
jgi:hypothetical protein